VSSSQPVSLQLCGYVKVGTKQGGKHFMSVFINPSGTAGSLYSLRIFAEASLSPAPH